MYYFGARYYDPRTSVWQSADAILGKYLPTSNNEHVAGLPGIGGVYNSLNLGLYTYGHNSPIKYTDPDGNAVILAPAVYEGILLLTAGTAGAAAAANDPAAQDAVGKVVDKAIMNIKIAGFLLTLPAQIVMNESGEGDVGAEDAESEITTEDADEWIYGPKNDPKINDDGSTNENIWTTPDDFGSQEEAQDKLDTFKPAEGRRRATIPGGTEVQRGKTPGNQGIFDGSGGANETKIPGGLPPGSVGPWEPL